MQKGRGAGRGANDTDRRFFLIFSKRRTNLLGIYEFFPIGLVEASLLRSSKGFWFFPSPCYKCSEGTMFCQENDTGAGKPIFSG